MTIGPILTINCGSSSVRVSCIETDVRWRAHFSGIGRPAAQLTFVRAGELKTTEPSHATDHGQALGMSGLTGDMAELLASRDPRAEEAVDVFCRTGRRWLAGLAGLLGGLDRVVFTGGIGENAPRVRMAMCEGLAFMGIELDSTRNAASAEMISRPGAPVLVEVRAADEEGEIARETRALMAAAR